jgi:hypothetical protein
MQRHHGKGATPRVSFFDEIGAFCVQLRLGRESSTLPGHEVIADSASCLVYCFEAAGSGGPGLRSLMSFVVWVVQRWRMVVW